MHTGLGPPRRAKNAPLTAIGAGITQEIVTDVRVDVMARRLPYFGALYHGLKLYAHSRCRWCRRKLTVDGRQWLVCAKCDTKYPALDMPTRPWPRLS